MVVDSTDRERMSVTKQELHKMLSHENLKSAVVLVFANKQDLKGAMTSAEVSDALGLPRYSLPIIHALQYQRPPVSHSSMLRINRRRVRSASS